MSLDALVTRMEVSSNGELYAGFRDIGGIYFPNWKHLFVTRIIGRNSRNKEEIKKRNAKYKKITENLKEDPELNRYKTRLKNKYWWISQIFCPIKLKQNLPKEFVKGNYTLQARWRLVNPGNYITLDEKVLDILNKKKDIQERINLLKRRIKEDRSAAYATRTFNDLDEAFEEYDLKKDEDLNFIDNNIKEIKEDFPSLRKINKEIFTERKDIADCIRSANGMSKGKAKITYSRTRKKREHLLRVEQEDFSYLKEGRYMSKEDILSKKWMFMDIEIPFFRRDKPEISWVGVSYYEKGKISSEIFTLHDPGIDMIKGYKIRKFKDEDSLIKTLSESINKENPDFVSTYNTRFDLIKLRESEAGFPIGEDKSDPLFKVTTHFFERICIKDRFVIDFLRWQKIARAYDINAKLEMAAGFEKDISYDEMEKLEDISFKGGGKGKEAAKKIGSYLAEDVDRLKALFELDEFKKNIEDICWMGDNFNLNIERMLYSSNCINDIQEKEYFTELGIYRGEVPPHIKTRKMQSLKTRAKEAFQKHVVDKSILQRGKKGLSKEVYKVFIPTGDFFRDIIKLRFPDIDKFYRYKDQIKKDKNKGNKKRLYFLERYANALSRWITEDYGSFIREEKKLDRLLKDADAEEFESAYHSFRNFLSKNSEWGVYHLNKGNLSVDSIIKYSTYQVDEFIKKNNMDYKRFQKMINQRDKVIKKGKNIIGNYGVFPDRRFLMQEKKRKKEKDNSLIIKDILSKRFGEINKFLEEQKLEVIAQEGNYLYLTGEKEALEKEEAPVVLVDEIPALYNADHPYYEKFGFFSHMKIKDEPGYHMNIFEMRNLGNMLKLLTEGKNNEAKETYEIAMEKLCSKDIPLEELIFFNKSKNMYFAYADEDEEDKKGRIFFIDDDKSIEKRTELMQDNDKGLRYFNSEERGNPIKVYITDLNSINVKFEEYIKRFEKKGKTMLAPVIEKIKEDKNEKEKNNNPIQMKLF